jgi:hypothetical protein
LKASVCSVEPDQDSPIVFEDQLQAPAVKTSNIGRFRRNRPEAFHHAAVLGTGHGECYGKAELSEIISQTALALHSACSHHQSLSESEADRHR